ncbi:hypothetical protein ABK040_004525 [Willaertia magna]
MFNPASLYPPLFSSGNTNNNNNNNNSNNNNNGNVPKNNNNTIPTSSLMSNNSNLNNINHHHEITSIPPAMPHPLLNPSLYPGMVPMHPPFIAPPTTSATSLTSTSSRTFSHLHHPHHQQQTSDSFFSTTIPPNAQHIWQKLISEMVETSTFKNELPLARIKKIMKSDEEVRTRTMISAEAPILFAKACEMFIIELTLHAWVHTEDAKRRTLQRNDIATAISKTDIFDFLIDIVTREDGKPAKNGGPNTLNTTATGLTTGQVGSSQQQLKDGSSSLVNGNGNDNTSVVTPTTLHPFTTASLLQPPLTIETPSVVDSSSTTNVSTTNPYLGLHHPLHVLPPVNVGSGMPRIPTSHVSSNTANPFPFLSTPDPTSFGHPYLYHPMMTAPSTSFTTSSGNEQQQANSTTEQQENVNTSAIVDNSTFITSEEAAAVTDNNVSGNIEREEDQQSNDSEEENEIPPPGQHPVDDPNAAAFFNDYYHNPYYTYQTTYQNISEQEQQNNEEEEDSEEWN